MQIKRFRKDKLKLENDGHLSLFFTGVGSAFSKEHYQTNLLIIKGKDHLMIDCGTKTPQAFYDIGIPVTDIRNFLITHSHADHIGGLEEIILMGRYVKQVKPRIFITEKYQKILWPSLMGGTSFNEKHNNKNLDFKDLWEVVRPLKLKGFPRETFEINIGSLNIKIFRTKHVPDNASSWEDSFWSCGVIIDERIMFTSDTRFDRELIESFLSLYNLEMIFHDCQFYTGGVHAGIDELDSLPGEIKKKIILVHFGDNWKGNKKKVRQYGFFGLGKQHHYYNFY